MSGTDHATTCACCTGVTALVPAAATNRPGLPALSWRVGTHPQFVQTMHAGLTTKERLRELGRRTPDDFTIALIDAWAVTLDVLAFYQERIVNESYLRTAVERSSLLELARSIGYELRPGVAAGTRLAFMLDAAPGSPAEVTIPAGTAAQSVPVKEEVPQTFETSSDLLARPRWNALRPRASYPQVVDAGTRSLYVKGTAANVRIGDPVLLVTGAGGVEQTFLRVQAVQQEPERARTLVTLQANAPAIHAYELDLGAFASMAAGTFGEVTSALAGGTTVSTVDLQTSLLIGGNSIDDLIASLASVRQPAPAPPTPGMPGLYALRVTTAVFGHNAPPYKATPREWRPVDEGGWMTDAAAPYPHNWDDPTWPVTVNSHEVDYGSGRTVMLDQDVKSLVAGDWVVLDSRLQGPRVYQIEEAASQSVADFGLSAKATRVVLKAAPGGGASTGDIDRYTMRETSVHASAQYLELAEVPIDTIEAGTTAIEVLDLVPDLVAGRQVVLVGERVGEYAGVTGAEELDLADVGQGLFTTLVFAKPLAFAYKRESVVIHANVASATHGQRRSEVLGSGDAAQPFQAFTLKQAPLTHVSSAASPSGAASTLEVRVNGVAWHEAPSFFPLASTDRRYVVRLDDAGKTIVQFGDGERSARVPTGSENVTATYRSGLGTVGLVGANRITLLPRKPLGVRSVTNPVASAGAQDAETRDGARENAPLTVRTLDRVVSLTDFEDFARAFSGIGKARAEWVWAGSQRVVHVTVSGPDGADVPPGITANLLGAIDAARMPHQPVRVAPCTRLYFTLTASIAVDPDHDEDAVVAAADTALRTAFAFGFRAFGARVAASDVIATLERVTGVTAVDLDALTYLVDTGGNTADAYGLPAQGARYDVTSGVIVPAQLLLITPAPLDLRVMA